MNPQVLRMLTWLSVFFLGLGAVLPYPEARIALIWISGALATSPLAFGSTGYKAAGMAILMGCVWLTTRTYSGAGGLLS